MDRVSYEPLVIQELINLHRRGELNLNPWYQRRAVWQKPQQSYLVNTLFEQKPVPTLYIRHTLDLENERSLKEVVDGQQRIRSILDYRKDLFSARHPKYKRPKLYSELSSSERESFLMTSLSVGYLIGSDERDVIEIFGRINSVSKTLNAQEKRNATFSGEFKQFCLKKSSELVAFWRNYNIFSATKISRMEEVEFIADLTMNLSSGLQDYSAAKLTKYYKENDEEFKKWEESDRLVNTIFGKIGELDRTIISDTIFSRPPILFSLVMVLKDHERINSTKLAKILIDIDRRFSDEDLQLNERPQSERDFIEAAAASTQRIASRRKRDKYLREQIG